MYSYYYIFLLKKFGLSRYTQTGDNSLKRKLKTMLV